MQNQHFRKTALICGAFLVWTLIANCGEAQVRRAVRRDSGSAPVQPAPTQVAPDQSAPSPADETAANRQSAGGEASQPGEDGKPMASAEGAHGRLIRGNTLIGMTIWGKNRQRVGIVKDFVIDYQEGCPTLYFAMAPAISGWGEEYVVVPFDAFQVGYDQRQRANYFVLNVGADNLRRAPHLAVNRWNTFQDREFFTSANRFYRVTQRTVAKPNLGVDRDNRGTNERQMRDRPEGQRQSPARQTPPYSDRKSDRNSDRNSDGKSNTDSGTDRGPARGTDRQPDNRPQPPAPEKSDSGSSKPEPRHDR